MKKHLLGIAAVLLASVFTAGAQPLSQLQSGVKCPAGVSQADWNSAIAAAHGSLDREHILLSTVMKKPAVANLLRPSVRQRLASMQGSVPIVEFLMIVHVSINRADLAEKLLAKQIAWEEFKKQMMTSTGMCACEVVVDRECCGGASTCRWSNGQCSCNP